MAQISFQEIAEAWLVQKKIFLKESTYYHYSLLVHRHLTPYFADTQLAFLTEDRIQEFILYLSEKGSKRVEKGLSESSVRDILMVLKMILRYADKKGIYQYKKMELRYPKQAANDRSQIVLPQERGILLKAIYQDWNSRNAGILLCMQTGLRIGELCSLQWKDIDLKRGILSVSKTVQRIFDCEQKTPRSKVIISTPKSDSSRRDIPISEDMKKMLEKLSPKSADCYLLTGTIKFLEPHTYRVYYKNFLKRNNLDYIKFHSLRHSFASSCIGMGIDCKVVSELLGHSSVRTTMDLYVHPQLEEKKHCIELISSSLQV